MGKMNDEQLRIWAIEQAVILITAAPATNAPRETVEDIADRLVKYVKDT